MLKIEAGTTWWSPIPNTVIDARDIASVTVTYIPILSSDSGVPHRKESYLLHIYLTGATTEKREFNYVSLEAMNAALSQIGLRWEE